MKCNKSAYRSDEGEVAVTDNGSSGCVGDIREEECRVQLH